MDDIRVRFHHFIVAALLFISIYYLSTSGNPFLANKAAFLLTPFTNTVDHGPIMLLLDCLFYTFFAALFLVITSLVSLILRPFSPHLWETLLYAIFILFASVPLYLFGKSFYLSINLILNYHFQYLLLVLPVHVTVLWTILSYLVEYNGYRKRLKRAEQ